MHETTTLAKSGVHKNYKYHICLTERDSTGFSDHEKAVLNSLYYSFFKYYRGYVEIPESHYAYKNKEARDEIAWATFFDEIEELGAFCIGIDASQIGKDGGKYDEDYVEKECFEIIEQLIKMENWD